MIFFSHWDWVERKEKMKTGGLITTNLNNGFELIVDLMVFFLTQSFIVKSPPQTHITKCTK